MPNVQRGELATWIAILAILLNTFAPAVSHALGGTGSAPWAEICSAGGFAAPRGERRPGDAPAKPSAAAFQHCPYCGSHGASFEALPASPALQISAQDAEPAAPSA